MNKKISLEQLAQVNLNTKIKNNNKQGVSILKSFSKCSSHLVDSLISKYSYLFNNTYEDKNVLFWAAENKNSLVLQKLINYYKENSISYSEEYIIKNVTYNLMDYCLKVKNFKTILVCIANGIFPNNIDFSLNKNSSFIFDYNYNPENKTLIHHENNLLFISLLLQIKELFHFLFNNEYEEKEHIYNNFKENLKNIILHNNNSDLNDQIILQFFSSLKENTKFNYFIDMCDFFKNNLDTHHTLSIIKNMENYFSESYIRNNISSLSYINLKETSISQWEKIYQISLAYDIKNFPFINNINKIILSIKLKNTLKNEIEYKKISKI